ncbi:MAG: hypothetical protein NZ992_04995 [Candidatus Korarchaeum sp.]|nr:hypothetical protein [Candidatus Korarchaeum sp.]
MDRLVIIVTDKYSGDEIEHILRIRAKEESIELSEQALKFLKKLGEERSLRYAVQILGIAGVKVRSEGRKEVDQRDVEEVASRFSDVKEAVDHLKKYEEELLR